MKKICIALLLSLHLFELPNIVCYDLPIMQVRLAQGIDYHIYGLYVR